MKRCNVTRTVTSAVVLFSLCFSVGCATRNQDQDSGSGTGTGSSPIGADYTYVTGNWDFTAKDSKAAPNAAAYRFTGVVYEQGGATLPHFATSVLRSNSPCYAGAILVPSDGSVSNTSLQMASFSVLGQVLTIGVQKDATAQTLSGTYSIKGGMCDGQSGTLTGQRYASATGTYAGTIGADATRTATIGLTQAENGSGSGTFVLNGTARFTGIPCLSSGTVDPAQSFVSGKDVTVVVTSTSSATAVLTGSIDTSAKTLQLQTATIAGGGCAATYSGGTLSRS